MVKVKNGIATREPIPQFLVGLASADLADLSWTDPQLGVSDCAWWPEDDQSPALGEFERYGDETLTVDAGRRVVVVVREVVPWSAEEIEAHRKSLIPESVTMRQARQAMLSAGILAQVDALIAAMPGEEGESARIDWNHAQEVKREWPLIGALGPQMGLTEQQIDDLFIYAATIPQ
jgi:hypothetical protein